MKEKKNLQEKDRENEAKKKEMKATCNFLK
jgi:hypothetical protein